MFFNLENEILTIKARTFGGELTSIKSKKSDIEFLWTGNPEYWKYHAPVLFPTIGKVKDGKYLVNNKTFELPQHGLARISTFNLINQTSNSMSFELKYSEESLKIYPYKFSLIITYTLIGNKVETSYEVKNLDDKTINFSIGAHPAYMCPILENESLNDYYFEFEKKETAKIMLLDPSTGLFNHNYQDYLNNNNKIALSKELFKNDALVFESGKLNSNKITVKTDKHNTSIEFDFTNFPYLGLWAPATGAPFVCIEPWFGHADFEDFNGEFKDKAGILSLDINQSFKCTYSVSINE